METLRWKKIKFRFESENTPAKGYRENERKRGGDGGKNRRVKGKMEGKRRRIRNGLRDGKLGEGFSLVSLLVPAFMIQI